MISQSFYKIQHRQQGSALVISMLIMIMMSLLTLSSIRATILEQKMTINKRDVSLSFESAESALREAENWLIAQETLPAVLSSCSAFPCVVDLSPAMVHKEQSTTWWENNTAPIGDAVSGVVWQPHYMIEYLAFVPNSSIAIGGNDASSGIYYYRVTARATGYSDGVVTVLSSIVSRRF